MDPVRIALLGAGGIAATHFEAIASLPNDVTLVAVVEPDAQRAAATSARLGVPTFSDVEELLRAGLSIGGAIVCTPPNTHASIGIALLEAGIAVLCEKPLAPNRADLHRMLASAHRHDRPLMMASKFRYSVDVILA